MLERICGYGALATMRNAFIAAILPVAPVWAETVTIAALGDSLTQGYGLPQEQGFVPQLEAWLTGKGADVTLINAGVSGDTTQGGLSRVAWTLTPEVDVMLVALGGNDLLRGIDPGLSRSNLSGILAAGQSAGVDMLLIGMQAPGNYGPDYKAKFDAIYPELAAEYGIDLYPSFFAVFSGAGDVPGDLTGFLQRDGIHPNAAGVAKIVDDMGAAILNLLETRAR